MKSLTEAARELEDVLLDAKVWFPGERGPQEVGMQPPAFAIAMMDNGAVRWGYDAMADWNDINEHLSWQGYYATIMKSDGPILVVVARRSMGTRRYRQDHGGLLLLCDMFDIEEAEFQQEAGGQTEAVTPDELFARVKACSVGYEQIGQPARKPVNHDGFQAPGKRSRPAPENNDGQLSLFKKR